MRLCLNALALKEAFAEMLLQDSSFERDQYVQKAAMAALDILQAFCESVSSDHQLAFCIDVSCCQVQLWSEGSFKWLIQT